jgi:hypothetical protein
MALAVSPTLAELRLAVATRVGMRQQVLNSTAHNDLLDEQIRSAFNLLINEAEWIVLHTVQDTITGQHAYDVPDNIAIGDIDQITVENIYGRELPLAPGVAYYERNAFKVSRGVGPDDKPQSAESIEANSCLPLRWEIRDSLLMVYPAPNADEYPTLKVWGKALPREPYGNGDRSFIDKEAHVLATVIALKTFWKQDSSNDRAILDRHLSNMRAKQSDGESVQIGPVRSQRYPSGGNRSASDREQFWPDFQPFPAGDNY